MKFANVVMTTSKVVAAIYRILATSIFGYYLIKETIRSERDRRKNTNQTGG